MPSKKSLNKYKIRKNEDKNRGDKDSFNLEDKITFRIPKHLKIKIDESIKNGEFENKSQLIRKALNEYYQRN